VARSNDLTMRKIFFLFLTISINVMVQAQQAIPLYGDIIPNSRPVNDQEKSETSTDIHHRISVTLVSRPTLAIFLPPKAKANGTAVIVCPGGSYSHLAMSHEGFDIAKKLNEMGVAAFVLKYRLPSDVTMVDKEIGPLQDAQRAIQLVRQNAATWHVDTARVGIMGFSAGGHLASTAGTHFMKPVIDNPNQLSLKPDFMILIYPVISFDDSIGHRGSRDNLIGRNPSSEKIREYSNEQQVDAHTPPAFLVHAEDDRTVPVVNSLYFYEALQRNKVPSELHIYPKGGHGFGMDNPTTKDRWMERLQNWLGSQGWLRQRVIQRQ
jgi:acetyl esterase/lipase